MRQLWADKYRPQTLKDYIFSSKEQKNAFQNMVDEKNIPHLLLSGHQGAGKTSMVHCLINELNVDPMDVKIINSSVVREHVKTVEEEIIPFCEPLPMGDFRIVLLEEFDRFSAQGQQALRSTIEEYEDRVRFILTCNYRNKILPAIHSRMQEYVFEQIDEDSLLDLIVNILENENITFEDPEVVFSHIHLYSPDIRKIINSMEQHCIQGELYYPKGKKQTHDQLDEWHELWENGRASMEQCKELCKHADHNNYESFYRSIYENIEKNPIAIDMDDAIPLIAKHLYQASFVADQDIMLESCIIQLFTKVD